MGGWLDWADTHLIPDSGIIDADEATADTSVADLLKLTKPSVPKARAVVRHGRSSTAVAPSAGTSSQGVIAAQRAGITGPVGPSDVEAAAEFAQITRPVLDLWAEEAEAEQPPTLTQGLEAKLPVVTFKDETGVVWRTVGGRKVRLGTTNNQ